MKHNYRALQHWNQWLAQDELGEHLLRAEQAALKKILQPYYGKHAVLIGVSKQSDLLKASTMTRQTLLSPLIYDHKETNYIEAELHELPLSSGSVDLVILPHTFEFIDNPRQLLAEACRVIKPEGIIVVCGFNPYGSWGLKKLLVRDSEAPWHGNFVQASKIKQWLRLADFEMENQTSALFSPPVATPDWMKKINFLETIGNRCCSVLGGDYIVTARAKVIPLTPIKMKWTQQFSGLRLPTTISGNLAGTSYK